MSARFRITNCLAAFALPAFAVLQTGCSLSPSPGTENGGTGGAAAGSGTGGTTSKGGTGGSSTGGTAGAGAATGGTSGTGAATGGTSGTGAATGGTSGSGSATGGTSGAGAATGGTSGTGAATGGTSGAGASAGGTSAGGTGGTSSGGTGAGGAVTCPDFDLPAAAALTYMNDKMPNPWEFKFMDLPDVTTKALWECRRQEISAMAQEYLYGHMPPPATSVTGTVNGGTISVSVTGPSGTATFSVNASGSGDILVIDFGAGAPKPANSRSASLNPSGLINNIRTAYGSTDVGIAMAAAWGVGRIIDVLELNPSGGIDPEKVVTTGCSTNGKLAAIAAAFEPRVALGVPVEAGACGTAAWRVSKEYGGSDSNNDCQDIEHLETNWLGTVADPFRNGQVAITKLPFDQHEVLAIRAPAPMMVFNNEKGWAWLCAKGNVAAAQGTHAIYRALGVGDNFGFAESSASHGHCSFPNEHNSEVQAFYAKFLNGDAAADTSVMRWHMDSDEEEKWFDWNMDLVLD